MSQKKLTPKPSPSRRLKSWLIAPPIVVLLSVALLTINLLQLLSVVLLPFSAKAFRACNSFAADTWWGWSVRVAQIVYGVESVVTGDTLPRDENALLVVNHQGMTDINFLLALGKRHGRLGDFKWFIKNVFKYVPGVGWGTMFLDCLFVKRNWSRDRRTIERVFARLNRHEVPFWIVLFAEGTRLTETKLATSQAWAKAHSKPVLEHVLAPRPAGFTASVQGLGNHLHAVYDITIGYPDGVPTIWQYIAGYVPRAHLHVRRFPATALPSSKDDLATG